MNFFVYVLEGKMFFNDNDKYVSNYNSAHTSWSYDIKILLIHYNEILISLFKTTRPLQALRINRIHFLNSINTEWRQFNLKRKE
jgi:hypothetical protein